jgi:hypothetical protein
MMKMGCVARELLHGLAAQLREAGIFERDPERLTTLSSDAGLTLSGEGADTMCV